MSEQVERATFAGGCFWCMVKPFEQMDGILSVTSGFTGGDVPNPSYERVKTGTTGHYEAVEITFHPEIFSYEQLLDLYWPQTDPTDADGQFEDRGSQYRTAIFYHTETQKNKALASKEALAASGRFKDPIVTEILPAQPFYAAEDYHQQFYKKQPEKYKQNRVGRDDFHAKYW